MLETYNVIIIWNRQIAFVKYELYHKTQNLPWIENPTSAFIIMVGNINCHNLFEVKVNNLTNKWWKR